MLILTYHGITLVNTHGLVTPNSRRAGANSLVAVGQAAIPFLHEHCLQGGFLTGAGNTLVDTCVA